MLDRMIVIYARPPIQGEVKTRLQPGLSPQQGLALYEAMLCDTIERMLGMAGGSTGVCVSFSAAHEPTGELARLLAGCRPVETQQGADLGERMAITIQRKLRAGIREVVLIGSDAPGLPATYVTKAFAALGSADVALGPAEDGGYYLVAARRLHPRMFQSIPWGSDRVLSITRRRLRDSDVSFVELPPWYDVDTPEDVARLWRDLQGMRSAAAPDLPQRTFRLLSSMATDRSIP